MLSVCWPAGLPLCLTLYFNVTPLYLSVPLPRTLPAPTCIAAAVIYTVKKHGANSPKRPQTTQRKTKRMKCHEPAELGGRWRGLCSEMTHESVASAPPLGELSKCDPSDIHFKRPPVPAFAQSGRPVLYESIHTFWWCDGRTSTVQRRHTQRLSETARQALSAGIKTDVITGFLHQISSSFLCRFNDAFLRKSNGLSLPGSFV